MPPALSGPRARRWRGAASLSGLVFCAAIPMAAQGVQPLDANRVSLTSLTVTGPAEAPSVVIAATGPLPRPVVGVLENPPRIYLDLKGIETRATEAGSAAGWVVARVRAGQHDVDPPVTRVVIDLVQPATYSLDLTQQRDGRLRVSLSSRTHPRIGSSELKAAAAPRTPAATASRVSPADGSPHSPAPLQGQAAGGTPVAQPRQRIEALVARFAAARGILESLDQQTEVPPDRLAAAQTEFEQIRAALNAMTSPRRLQPAQDLLRNATTLALRAIAIARAPEGSPASNAATAAAGALILLERVQADQNAR